MGLFDERAGDDRAVLEHILQVHQVAVVHMLGVIVAVVEVDDALAVGLHNILGQQNALAQVAADLTGHIVPLGGIHHGVLVGVFLLGLFVVAFDEGKDLVVGGVGLTHQGAGVAVGDIVLGHLKRAVGHDVVLHHVLDLLHSGGAVHFLTLQLYGLGDALDLHWRHAVHFIHGLVGLGDGNNDLRDVETDLCAVSLDDLHRGVLLVSLSLPARMWVDVVCTAIIIYYILCRCKRGRSKYREIG